MMLKLYNTLSRKKEVFNSIKKSSVSIYTCGPTVYNSAHIGNLRTYIFEDILKKVLLFNKFKVKHVMNITDVGHLTSDGDTGEDKMEKGSKREGKSAWDIAKFYTKEFKDDIKKLNILEPDIWCKATENIKEQIDFVKELDKKGFVYEISDGLYFDTSRLKDYGKLARLKIEKLKPGVRVKLVHGKKNSTDFALWKFSPKGEKRQMEWKFKDSYGFPGWHIECSAMSMKFLGEHFDIHCGGVDHIPVHHTNEIAQSEALLGKKWVNYWLHGEFLKVDGGKMSKSLNNFYTLNYVIKKGFDALVLRYFYLSAHYRTVLNFTFEGLEGAKNSYEHLKDRVLEIKSCKDSKGRISKYKNKFLKACNDDLNTPQALAVLWDVLKTNSLGSKEKYSLVLDFDTVLGLGLGKIKKSKVSKGILDLIKNRDKARKEKDWKLADKIRDTLKKKGVVLEDTDKGVKWKVL